VPVSRRRIAHSSLQDRVSEGAHACLNAPTCALLCESRYDFSGGNWKCRVRPVHNCTNDITIKVRFVLPLVQLPGASCLIIQIMNNIFWPIRKYEFKLNVQHKSRSVPHRAHCTSAAANRLRRSTRIILLTIGRGKAIDSYLVVLI